MFFFAFIPILSFLLCFLIIYSRQNSGNSQAGIRDALVQAFLLIALFVLVLTELLSYHRLLRFNWVLAGWTILLAGFLVYVLYNKLFISSAKRALRTFNGLLKMHKIVAVFLILFPVSFFLALIYPTNNFDSLTYHMARVAHWEQNQSISHYKTHIVRQIEFPPFAEWIILHLQILTGGDRFANCVQLFFLSGCIFVVSLIAKHFGATGRQQIVAALMACFLPMAVLQSNTTQNDLVSSFFILGFVYFTLKAFNSDSISVLFFGAISLGLAWLTKSTTYLFTVLFCCWYIIILLKNYRKPLKELVRKAFLFMMIPVIAISINYGHYYRNVFLSGSPLGNGADGTVNEEFAIKPLAFVAVKNLMNHLPITKEIRESVSAKAAEFGIEPDDPKYNMTEMKWMITGLSFHEDYAQNFLHVMLIFICLIGYFIKKDMYNKPPDTYLLLILTLIATVGIFCVLLNWQPWSNRLETPLFMLFSVFIGIEIGKWKRWISKSAVFLVLAYGFMALSCSSRHPILPVESSIFSKRFDYNNFIYDKEMIDLQKHLDGKPYKKIGLYMGGDSWDYVYYKLLRGKGDKKRILNHIFVPNQSSIYLEDFLPDALITNEKSVDSYDIQGKLYYRTNIYKDAVLFEPR